MPRDLADVLHYFMPEIDGDAAAPEAPPAVDTSSNAVGGPPPRVRERFAFASDPLSAAPESPPLSVLGLPIGDRDVVRAALAWNLSVETARLGDAALLLAPASTADSPLWPEPGPGPLGTELVLSAATTLADLEAHAMELAKSHATKTRGRGIVFVRVPPAWIVSERASTHAIRWWLLLSSANRRELRHAHDIAQRLRAANPEVQIGATIHGVSAIAEASSAFEHLARLSREDVGSALRSYGLLVDDLHVYRAIAAQRPIGLAHPQAPATRALMDVARLLAEDTRSRTFG